MRRLPRSPKRLFYFLFGDLSGGWWLATVISAALVLLPVLSIIGYASQGSGDLWPHLRTYVLPHAFLDTFLLLTGVGILVIGLGTGGAWLVTTYEFRGRGLLSIALLLPLAVPTYIVAFAYVDLWHPISPIQVGLRDLLGISNPRDLRLPEIRSLGGCILLLGLVLYPYVYIPARALFTMQAASALEAARMLGASPARTFQKIALPLARPAIALGASLALMEALNDIGAAEFLGVRTLTTSVYSTWINRGSLAGAAQIALFMLAIVISLLALERWARGQQRYANSGRQTRHLARRPLGGWSGKLTVGLAWLPVFFGFILPVSYLVIETVKRMQFAGLEPALIRQVVNTLSLSFIATLIATLLAFVLAYSLRLAHNHSGAKTLVRCASLGYAIPGTVLAIGLLAPLNWLDASIDTAANAWFNISTGLLITGSGAALIYAYVARFLAIGVGNVEAGLTKLPRSFDDAAHSLGVNSNRMATRVHLPLSRPALAAAMLLVFVDCMKELPATLLLRPLNFETLATHLYAEAARGTYESGAIAALLIVLAGLVPILLLTRYGNQEPAST